MDSRLKGDIRVSLETFQVKDPKEERTEMEAENTVDLIQKRGYVQTSTASPWSAKPSFDQYVSKERGRSDLRSLPFLRETQLYSRSSRGHLRILGRKIDAIGKDGDPYAKLIVESDNFGRVKIKGDKTNYYLCFKKNGRLIGRKISKAAKSKCVFYEKYASNSYTEFSSAFKPEWLIMVAKKGHTRPGFKGRRGQKSVQFIQRPTRIIIETNNVGQSFVDGLSQHIAQLLRNFRAQVGSRRSPGLYISQKRKIERPQKEKEKNPKKAEKKQKRDKKRKRRRKRKRKLRLSRKRIKGKERKSHKKKMEPNNF